MAYQGGQFAASIARHDPSRPALTGGGGASLRYGELASVLVEVAEALAGWGIGRSHRVGVALDHGIDNAALLLAIADYCTLVPMAPGLKASEAAAIADAARLDAVLVPDAGARGIRDAALVQGALVIEVCASALEARSLAQCLTVVEPAARCDPSGEQSLALILSTSGTTARPKLVPHTATSLVAAAQNWVRFHELGPDDRTVLCLPLFHSFGFTGCIAPTILSGGQVHCLDDRDPQSIIAAIDARSPTRPTWLSCVPTILHHVTRHLEATKGGFVAPDLRFVRTGTAQLTEDVRLAAERALGTAVLASYGLSETGSVAANPPPPAIRRPGSVGLAYGAEVIVADSTGAAQPSGVLGEVLVRGATVTAGYLDAPEENAQLFRDGWLRTGDLGSFDADGYLTLAGRHKHMINRGGTSLSPLEIEQAISDVPGVDDVAVVGIAHQTLGEQVAAALVWTGEPGAGARSVAAALQTTLSPEKIPTRWLEVAELERSAVGKVRRDAVVERFAAETPPVTEPERGRDEWTSDVALLWAEVLQVDRVGDVESFVGLGGDSLQALVLVERMSTVLNRTVEVRDVVGSVTFADFMVEFNKAPVGRTNLIASELLAATAASATGAVSSCELGLWLEEQFEPESGRYNESITLAFPGRVDAARLGRSMDTLIERHEALRTSFATVDGIPCRNVASAGSCMVAVHDIEAADLEEAVARLAVEPFDLITAPLWRLTVLRADDGRDTVLFTTHHIINDQRSSNTLVSELAAAYGDRALAPPPPFSLESFGAWQQSSAGAASESDRAYWSAALSALPDNIVLHGAGLDGAAANPSDPTSAEALLGPEALLRLAEVGRSTNATAFTVIAAAIQRAVAQVSQHHDVVLGAPTDLRPTDAMHAVVGCFVNTVPLRVASPADGPFADTIGAMRTAVADALEHRHVPFADLVAGARSSNPHRAELCDVVIAVVLEIPDDAVDFGPDEHARRRHHHSNRAKFGLGVDITAQRGGGVLVEVTADERHRPAAVSRLLESFVAVLGGL